MTAVVPTARSAGNYGCRSNAGAVDRRCPPGQRLHAGLDIQGAEGDYVYCPKDGIVTNVLPNGALSRYGNLLLIYIPEDDVTYVFAHLKELPRYVVGARIAAGTPVALVGHTGACRGAVGPHGTACAPCGAGGAFLCSGAHLHWEVRPGRVTVGPTRNGPTLDPSVYARAKGIAVYGSGVGRLGQTWSAPTSGPCANSNVYCDPNGFELGEDEQALTDTGSSSSFWWVIGGITVAALVVWGISRA